MFLQNASGFILYIVSYIYILLCPFTKVEESFNMQAAHDIIFHKSNLTKYDHFEFPGVVPRSFLGVLFINCIIYPFTIISGVLSPKIIYQTIFRITLGFFSNLSIINFYGAIGFDNVTNAIQSNILTASLFHIMFYSSRALPNIFAFIVFLNAQTALLNDDHLVFVLFSAISTLIFRSELLIYCGPLLLFSIYFRVVTLNLKLMKNIILSGLLSIALTVGIDSYFWNRTIWPEADVFYFNTILNKSSDWGTLPFYWYFAVFLPKALLMAFPFSLIGLLILFFKKNGSLEERKLKAIVYSAVIYVFLYSFLPHKELRFIIYTIPVFIFTCIYSFREISRSLRLKKGQFFLLMNKALKVSFVMIIVINSMLSYQFYLAASSNYPGGIALTKLNEDPQLTSHRLHVHIGNFAAQTGVTRFLQTHNHWIYNKTEGIDNPFRIKDFTHIIIEAGDVNINSRHVKTNFIELFRVKSFERIQFSYSLVKLSLSLGHSLRDALVVFERKDYYFRENNS